MNSIEIERLINEMALPDSFMQTVETGYYPLANSVFNKLQKHKKHKHQPLILGVQGVQGSGKSTCSEFLKVILAESHNVNCLVISIDDFYLTRSDRQALAQSVHPLFATRGVPGTHDLPLAEKTLLGLLEQKSGHIVDIPRFDKAVDDRCVKSEWDANTQPVDIVIFEGWCVGLPPLPMEVLAEPINTLEADQDNKAEWRSYVANKLNAEYQQLYGLLDCLLVIQAPSFECVKKWRLLQEQKLRDRVQAQGVSDSATKVMSKAEVMQFIEHYERLSEHALHSLPKIADWVMQLNEQHGVVSVDFQESLSWLVSSDLDGTLLDHHDYSWQAAKSAIRALKSRDIPIILNTSKTLSEVLHIQADMQLNSPVIVENGSAIFLPKNYVLEGQYNELSLAGEFYAKTFGLEREYILQVAHDLRAKHQYEFEGFSDWSIDEISTNTSLSMDAAARAADKRFSEPFIWQDTEEKFEVFSAQLASQQINILKGGRFFHLQGQTDKAQPLLWLKDWCQQQGLAIEQVICLGDNHNDVDMLNIADVAVCVKSPIAEIPLIKNQNIIYTKDYGPVGWNQAVLQLLI